MFFRCCSFLRLQEVLVAWLCTRVSGCWSVICKTLLKLVWFSLNFSWSLNLALMPFGRASWLLSHTSWNLFSAIIRILQPKVSATAALDLGIIFILTAQRSTLRKMPRQMTFLCLYRHRIRQRVSAIISWENLVKNGLFTQNPRHVN